MSRLPLLLVACALSAAPIAIASPPPPRFTDSGPEPLLMRVFEHIEHSRWDAALRETEALVQAYPKFNLGHLIKGDLLLARSRPLRNFGEGGMPQAGEQVADLRAEAIARLRAYRDRPNGNTVPRYLLQMRPDQKYAVVIDTEKARLYVYQNDTANGGMPRFVADYYIAYGKLGTEKRTEGDKKTPIGVYHVTSSIPRQKLPDFYGSGAFPINYPNEWDRKLGRTGHGIWLHGTPSDTFARPPRSSDGCVVLANQDLDDLARYLQLGGSNATPVIISNKVEWLSLDDWQSERQALLGMIDAWLRDWESLDHERYARHYARNFTAGQQDREAWLAQKRSVNRTKQWVKVAAQNISMFRSPGPEEVVVVTFEQDYRSNNLSNRMLKRQYWIKEDGRWKIVREGAA